MHSIYHPAKGNDESVWFRISFLTSDLSLCCKLGVSTGVSTRVSTRVPRKPKNFTYFQISFWYFWDSGSNINFFVKITCFLSSSNKNDAELSLNFIKIQFLDPKRAKLVQKSYGKFTESLRNFQDLSRRSHKGPYGP